MTLGPEAIGAGDAASPHAQLNAAPIRPAPSGTNPKRWWSRPWVVPLWVTVLYYLYYQMNPILSVPPDQAPVSPHPGFPAYYPLLIVHMTGGTIAMLTACLQVWPWMRRQHPKVHRVAGRMYVFAGTIPAFMAGMSIVWFAPPAGKLGVLFSVTGWLVTTVVGYVAIRRRNYALHRRFMLYSFAFVMNNIWGVAFSILWGWFDIQLTYTYLAEAARWVGWTVNLMLVQWWLERTARRPVV